MSRLQQRTAHPVGHAGARAGEVTPVRPANQSHGHGHGHEHESSHESSHGATMVSADTHGSTDTTVEARLALRAWLRLLACSNLIERSVRQQLRDKFETTLPRFDVLAQLDAAAHEKRRGLTMSDLSRRLMVTNGNLTSLIERLVRERLVSRTAVATDRRAQLVKLTPQGKAALDAMTPDHQRWIDSMFSALTHDERAQLHHLLGKLKASLQPARETGVPDSTHDV